MTKYQITVVQILQLCRCGMCIKCLIVLIKHINLKHQLECNEISYKSDYIYITFCKYPTKGQTCRNHVTDSKVCGASLSRYCLLIKVSKEEVIGIEQIT